MFVVNKIGSIKSANKSIKKCGKLLKTKKLSKSENLKGKTLYESKKLLVLEYVFTLL